MRTFATIIGIIAGCYMYHLSGHWLAGLWWCIVARQIIIGIAHLIAIVKPTDEEKDKIE